MSRTLKIVHVVDYLMPDMGYQESLLPKWNSRHGHETHIVTSDRYAPIADYDETWGTLLGPRFCGTGIEQFEGVTVHRLSTFIEWRMRPWLTGLINTVSRLSPDVIFCHGSSSPSAFRLARFANISDTPLLMDNHMIYDAQNTTPMGRVYYFGLKMLSRIMLNGNVDRFLGVADECCAFLESEQGIPIESISQLPLAVDTELFSPDDSGGRRARNIRGIPIDAKVVLQTGKLDSSKGAHILAAAMTEIMKLRPDLWLVFVGGGSRGYVEKTRNILSEAGVSDRMVVTPFVPANQLSEVYSMSDICVYPAATSLSCLEAAGCARPVIMTDLPASRWRAEHGVGICYETGDIDNLRKTIEVLLEDSSRRKTMGELARIKVLEHFSYDAIASQAERYMYEVVGERSCN